MPDITLPNGEVIVGVPEGTPKHVISQKAIAAGLATNKDFGYDDDVEVDASFLEGVGAGMTNVAKQVGNMVGVVDDEEIEEQAYLDRHMEFGNGGGGKFVGEMVATLPVSGGVAGVTAKAGNALRVASKGKSVLGRTMASRAGRAGVEGATAGSVLSGPDNRGTGAVVGGATGGALSGVGTMLGKTLGKGKVVEITNEAKQLQKMTGTFIPLSQSAEAGITKQIYSALLANIPGVGGKVRGQYKAALDDMRRFAGEHAIPDTAMAHNLVNLTGKESVEEMIGKLSLYWDEAFEAVKPWQIATPKNATPTMPGFLVKKVNKQGEGLVPIPQVGKPLTGADVLTLKTTLGEIIPTLGSRARAEAIKYQKGLDGLLKNTMNPSGKSKGAAARALQEYQDASGHYGAWQALQRAARKAKDNQEFTPAQLAKSATKTNANLNPANKTTQQKAGELGVHALEDFPSKQGLFQTAAALGLAGSGIAFGGSAGAAVYPVVVALGRLGASKGLQRFLSGQTKFQRLNRVMMRKYKDELQRLGATARQAAVILGADDAT